jgi:hypothetical protein
MTCYHVSLSLLSFTGVSQLANTLALLGSVTSPKPSLRSVWKDFRWPMVCGHMEEPMHAHTTKGRYLEHTVRMHRYFAAGSRLGRRLLAERRGCSRSACSSVGDWEPEGERGAQLDSEEKDSAQKMVQTEYIARSAQLGTYISL